MATVGLAMIVRDAAETIADCLASAYPLIDCWTIIDTGSEDETRQIIAGQLDGTPGRLLESEWVNFGHNRSELMAAAHGTADYLLLLDADMIVHLARPLPPLEHDVYEGFIQGGSRYALPFLVRGDRAWEYRGVAHSYLAASDDQPVTEAQLEQLLIEDRSHTTEAKLRRDLEALSAEHARRPLDARTCFYLAQTYDDLDMKDEAIAMFRARVTLDGWDEETYVARRRLGALLVENVSYHEGAQELLAAWAMRPQRNEALRTLAAATESVADKIPLPPDRLHVRIGGYLAAEPELPPLPSIKPFRRLPPAGTPLQASDVTAIIVTRGNVDLAPILETLPYPEVILWDNSKREHNYKVFGRYAAIRESSNPVIYWQDDDVIFTAHEELLNAYNPGRLVCNMDDPWIEACGYAGLVGMQGAGSICDSDIPERIFRRYLLEHPYDHEFLTEADFVFGTLVPFDVVDLGYQARPFADDADRLYQQPGQHDAKWRMIERCRALL
jgi:glycosyltransferase involved in cell wall biosynthesis